MKNYILTVRLDQPTLDALQFLSLQSDRPRANLIRQLVRFCADNPQIAAQALGGRAAGSPDLHVKEAAKGYPRR